MLEYGKEFRIIVICVAFFNMMQYRLLHISKIP